MKNYLNFVIVGIKVVITMKTCLVLYLILLVVAFAKGLNFHLPVDSEKCMREEIHKNVLVTGEYEVSNQASVKVLLKVKLLGCSVQL